MIFMIISNLFIWGENNRYVKEDLIIPHHYAFYDLIATRARGKSGPLFHFDVHDDVRSGPIDSRVEKDESHPGKVVTRAWYVQLFFSIVHMTEYSTNLIV